MFPIVCSSVNADTTIISKHSENATLVLIGKLKINMKYHYQIIIILKYCIYM